MKIKISVSATSTNAQKAKRIQQQLTEASHTLTKLKAQYKGLSVKSDFEGKTSAKRVASEFARVQKRADELQIDLDELGFESNFTKISLSK